SLKVRRPHYSVVKIVAQRNKAYGRAAYAVSVQKTNILGEEDMFSKKAASVFLLASCLKMLLKQ
ncbi:hypothetical protein ACQP3L_33120, partial [Escherichia coli]